MKGKVLTTIVLGTIALTGCTKTSDDTTTRRDSAASNIDAYIIVKENGGEITDVYKIDKDQKECTCNNVYFNSNGHSQLHDQYGNKIDMVNGDTKLITIMNAPRSETWDKYVEYHMEFESRSYQQVRDSVLKAEAKSIIRLGAFPQ